MVALPNPYRERVSFARLGEVLPLPDLIEIQRRSYDWFLQRDRAPEARRNQGLQAVFLEVFPIKDVYEKALTLEFVHYTIGEPKYGEFEARERDATFAAPLKIRVRLINQRTGEIREQDVYMGDLPLMTDRGTFIINGAERVIVNQLHRSPGIVFDHDDGKVHPTGRRLYSAKILPYRGAWIEMEYEVGDLLQVRLDRKRKIPVTTLLRAIGKSIDEDSAFDLGTTVRIIEHFCADRVKVVRLGDEDEDLASHPLMGAFTAEDVVAKETGEVLLAAGRSIDEKALRALWKADVKQIKAVLLAEDFDPTILRTLEIDDATNGDEAVMRIMEALRPGDAPPLEAAREELRRLYFDAKRYDLGEVGRYQLNKKLGFDPEQVTDRVLRPEDVVAVVRAIMDFNRTQGPTDDTDHLSNRRVRSVGELLQNQFRLGLVRMEKVINQRMTTQDEDTMTPQELINIKPVTAIVKEFFGSSQLSQFMDQTNPLAEVTHKRRLSALGPGGLKRERALSDVRDVHRTHYGRVCPIETPEGPNIGLIVSLATYARVNEFGFIETPYRIVKNGRVTADVEHLTADEEDRYVIAQASSELDPSGRFIEKQVLCRKREEYIFVAPEGIQFMDVSPHQIVSVSTALIPFLEHDDANRALMGSNMQRQAVPLLRPEAPVIGTGLEFKAAYDSGSLVVSDCDGEVVSVDARRILIKPKGESRTREHRLLKFRRSNQSTCVDQRPIVRKGEKVRRGQPIADGPATDRGDIALGRNVVVAFMSWEGYNFEDAIIISDRLVKEDVFTSIHIERFEVEARDTKIGKESITRDIPNLGEDALTHLGEEGIVKIGAYVRSGDILVGKVTPKGTSDLTPEHKLLYSIFGEKARDVRDTSLRVPHGTEGDVIDVKVFSRAAGDDLPPGVEQSVKVYVAQKRKIQVGDKMAGRHGNKGVVSVIVPAEDLPFMEDGTPIDIILNPLGVPSRMNVGQILETHFGWAAQKLGVHVASPVFNGAKEAEVRGMLADAGLPPHGKVRLFDGKTGEPFDNEVTVGVMYMLKLHHLVDDKIHARSTGPYSLVTQQPLGGKAQFGGQRLGEMEVWALEAYGAAYTLQELLTVKSDDVTGRAKIYESIVKGENASPPGIPESFNVLVRELQGLGLDIQVISEAGEVIELKESEEDYLYSGAAAALQLKGGI